MFPSSVTELPPEARIFSLPRREPGCWVWGVERLLVFFWWVCCLL